MTSVPATKPEADTGSAPESRRASTRPATRGTRTFAQKRAHDTHRALLAAAAELFAERGYDDTQTPDIARAAGVSVGTFYRYFADKRQAFVELMRQNSSDMFERVVGKLTPEEFGATQSAAARWSAMEHVINTLFETTFENPALLRVFLAMSMRDAEIAAIREEFEQRGRSALEQLLREVAPSDRIPDTRAAAEVIHIAAQEVALVTTGSRGVPTRADTASLRSALAEMLYRYVFGAEPSHHR